MRDHATDDLTTRSAVMVARAAAKSPYQQMLEMSAEDCARIRRTLMSALTQPSPWLEDVARVRLLAQADAALARAIDAVPGRG